jgi:hypothetical protein
MHRPLSPARDRTGGFNQSLNDLRPQSPARERMGSFNTRPQSPAREGSIHDMRPLSPARERTQGFKERRPQSPAREGTGNLADGRRGSISPARAGTRIFTDIFKGIQGHLQVRPQSPAREGANRSSSPVLVEQVPRVPSAPKLSSPLGDNEMAGITTAKCKYCSVRGTPVRMCSIGPHHDRACLRWTDTHGDGRPGAAGAAAGAESYEVLKARKTSDSETSDNTESSPKERLSAEDQKKRVMLQMQMLELKKKLEEQLRRLQVLDFVFSGMGCPRQLIYKRRALTK